jgi:hypothetical protein
MWDPQRLATLWAFTACYRDNFTLLTYILSEPAEIPLKFERAIFKKTLQYTLKFVEMQPYLYQDTILEGIKICTKLCCYLEEMF